MASKAQPYTRVERPTGVRHYVVAYAAALAVITYLDRVCISQALPAIQKDLGLGPVERGAILSAFGWAYALFEIPGGYLGDRIGPRAVLTRIVLWWSFFTAATGWAWNFVSLAVTRFLFGMGEAGCFPNLTKAFTTWLPEKERTRAQSVTWLSARWGGAFTPMLVTWVMGYIGWRHTFEACGVMGVIWAIAFLKWYRNDPRDNPNLNAAERELLASASKNAIGHGDVPWARFATSQQVWMMCLQYFCLSYGWYFYITWLPTYFHEARKLDLTTVAFFSTAPLLFGGIANPISAFCTSRLVRNGVSLTQARRIMAYIGFTGAAGFLVLSTRMADPRYATLAIGLASFSNDLVMPGAWGACMDVGGKHAGSLSGTMNMWGNIGGALCPGVIGVILKVTDNNWNLTFYVSAVIYLLGIVCWRFLDPVTPLEAPAIASPAPAQD
jgi:MFS transporter, ACS family, glucarate transporter